MSGWITLQDRAPAFLPAADIPLQTSVRPASLRAFELAWTCLGATLLPVSLIWDFSWESSIGADRFWSPPHLATHIGVWLSGLLGGWLILRFTLARHWGQPGSAIDLGPWSGPTGAWILLWSAALLEATFLLDSWWQRTYALSAGMWPPPQLLKAAGFLGMLCGARALASHATGSAAWLARSWLSGLVVSLGALLLTMTNLPNLQHTATFYLVSCALYPALLLAAGGPGRWSATGVALAYAALVVALVWFLPLFAARPLTPPIYNPVSHMMPPAFPLLLVVPAAFMDLARRLGLRQAVLCGLGFVLAFLPVQWFFARFLLSPGADNWFFAGGGHYWPYFLKIDRARTLFWGTKDDPFSWMTLFWSLLLATSSAWLGLRTSAWLSRLRR